MSRRIFMTVILLAAICPCPNATIPKQTVRADGFRVLQVDYDSPGA
ncbi:MAG: hypothetical protein IJR63_01955 [Synergistaceae bacterium]|nr:hypothetical protein [Synergistaceae bacterium]